MSPGSQRFLENPKGRGENGGRAFFGQTSSDLLPFYSVSQNKVVARSRSRTLVGEGRQVPEGGGTCMAMADSC